MPTTDTILSADTPFGEIRYFGFDGPIGDALRQYGQWAMAEIRFLSQFIAAGDTVLDGGANIGMHSMGFAAACGPDGGVIAVEASPETAGLLKVNIEKNALHQVRLVNAALGAAMGSCIIRRVDPGRPQNVGMLRVSSAEAPAGAASGLQVDRISIDSLELEQLSLLKLDVEGDEFEAIGGGLETIRRLRPTIMVELLNLSESVPILKLLTELRYKPFFCSFAVFDPDNFGGSTENVFGVARESGLLFLPEPGTVPIATPGTYVAAVLDVDDLARLLSEMPRFGDRTEHDRVLGTLVGERDRLEQALAAATAPAPAPAPAPDNSALLAEIQHVWRHLETLRTADEEARAEARAAMAALSGQAAETRAMAQEDRDRLRQATGPLEQAMTALGEAQQRDRARVEDVRLEARRLAEQLAAAQALVVGVERRLAATAGQIRGEFVRELARAGDDARSASGEEIARAAAAMREDVDGVIARLKAEVTSVREVLTNFDDHRGRMTERLDDLVARGADEIRMLRDGMTAQIAAIEDRQRRRSDEDADALRALREDLASLAARQELLQAQLDASSATSRRELETPPARGALLSSTNADAEQ